MYISKQSIIKSVHFLGWPAQRPVVASLPGAIILQIQQDLMDGSTKARRISSLIRQRLDLDPLELHIGARQASSRHHSCCTLVPFVSEKSGAKRLQHVPCYETPQDELVMLDFLLGNIDVYRYVVFLLQDED